MPLAGGRNGRNGKNASTGCNEELPSIAGNHLARCMPILVINIRDACLVNNQAQRFAAGSLPERECAGPGLQRANLIANLLRGARPVHRAVLFFESWRFGGFWGG